MTLEDNVPLYEKNNVIEEIPDIGVGRVDWHNNSLVVGFRKGLEGGNAGECSEGV